MQLLDTLRNDIDELRTSLLVEDVVDVQAPDDLSRRQQLLIASFVILSHAHIEEFIEGLFLGYIEEQEKSITEFAIPHCFVKLAMHFSPDLIGQGAGNRQSVQKICTTAKNFYISKIVKTNHGLKSNNVISLAKPLGLHSDLPNTCDPLLTALNTLGSKRGGMAHTSPRRQSTTETVYASQAVTWVDDVVDLAHLLAGYLKIGE